MADPADVEAVVPPPSLLNLATELQELIFTKYYEGTLDVSSQGGQLTINDLPSIDVELTCKALRDRSRAVRAKYESRTLTAEGHIFINFQLRKFCRDPQFRQLRRYITSIRFTNFDIKKSVFKENWERLILACKNLRNIDIHSEVEKKCLLILTQRYLPLDTDESKRILIADVLRNDWEPSWATSAVSRLLYGIEKAWDMAMSYEVVEDGIWFYHVPDEDIMPTIVLSTVAVDEKGDPFYHTVRISRSPGLVNN